MNRYKGELMKAKKRVWERDNYTCRYCGKEMKKGYEEWLLGLVKRRDCGLTVDHVTPRCKGGDKFADENLVTSCWDCNNKKSLIDSQKTMIDEITNVGEKAEKIKELLKRNLGKAEDFIIHESKEDDE